MLSWSHLLILLNRHCSWFRFSIPIGQHGALSYDVWWDWQITAYFVALATPQTTQVVSVVDKVGGTEKLMQQSDIGGSTAVKLDFSLDTPIIIMPRCSDSQE
jgi:hypothetical protein